MRDACIRLHSAGNTLFSEYVSTAILAQASCFCAYAGATSKAIQERNPWLTTNLSVLASCTAIVIGAIVLFSL